MKAPKHKHSRYSLILMELMAAILFFSLASAVCIQLFAKAHIMSRDASMESSAVIHVQTVAELMLADGARISDNLKAHYPHMTIKDNSRSIYFNKNWDECAEKDAAYRLDIAESDKSGIKKEAMSMNDIAGNAELYKLDVDIHVPNRR